ncbi:MAG TPA: Crp/Fnr family transcriptional regulator [Actinomycetota bacterium]
MIGPDDVSTSTGNGFLDRAPSDARDRLFEAATPHELVEGEILHESGQSIDTIYLPTTGIISLLAVTRSGSAVEAGLVGREGFAGIPGVLGRDAPRNVQAMSQIAGQALAVEMKLVVEEMDTSDDLAGLVKAYINAVWAETAQSVACNRLHSVNERCARWLLLVRDRLGRSEFRLTQEFLAMMLGIRRPSVSVAAEAMQEQGLISYHRGDLKILDGDRLRKASCECYPIIRAELDAALPGALGPAV